MIYCVQAWNDTLSELGISICQCVGFGKEAIHLQGPIVVYVRTEGCMHVVDPPHTIVCQSTGIRVSFRTIGEDWRYRISLLPIATRPRRLCRETLCVLIMIPSTPESPIPPSTPLAYTIAGCSEHSGNYYASNIIIDRPTDPASRWSGAHHVPNVKQWMLLRLENLCVLS